MLNHGATNAGRCREYRRQNQTKQCRSEPRESGLRTCDLTETCRLCEMGSTVGENAPGDMETVCKGPEATERLLNSRFLGASLSALQLKTGRTEE